ncbi:FkbM family methyltransferase [Nocardia tengchongensis]|uniref:FkbM family methyltransferase n=2 Tax=Nocardia tengchongensis TaxID=2055889 RepID=A0ABX8CLA8_9NOCA|nr:FkbM family methyltransferase [Nocardia tengchongensis]QVI20736.1 FkbM family methyltransferase [Nocardia tengchongensis]
MTTPQQFRLDNDRTVTCTSPAEARMLWRETIAADGLYQHAAAHLRPEEIVLDIGANIGLVTMMFAEKCPGIGVIAAEPVPMIFHCLQRNMAAHVPHGVSLRVAVGAVPGTLPFTWYPQASANSGLYADRERDDENTRIFLRNSGLDDESIGYITAGLHDGEQIDVDVTTVSAVLAEHAPDAQIGLLKVDVERAELDVLRGISETDWPRIRAVVAEVHDTDGRLAQFCELLSRHGLSPRDRQDPSLAGTELHEVYAARPSDY